MEGVENKLDVQEDSFLDGKRSCGRRSVHKLVEVHPTSRSMRRSLDALRAIVRELGDAAVAFSGGVDSSLVLKICCEERGGRVLAITAVSPSFPEYELQKAKEVAAHIGARHLVIRGKETGDERYRKNDRQRCYFCKSNLYAQLREVAQREGYRTIVNGINHDDLFDFRPGIKAAEELHVRAPLKEAGIGKAEVVELARRMGLPNWDKPASPCLSSRVPYGTVITPEILEKIEKAEEVLRRMGLRQFRVRYHKEIARIEVEKEEMGVVMEQAETIVQQFRAIGFRFVTLDLAGFRSGSLNEGILHEGALQRPRI